MRGIILLLAGLASAVHAITSMTDMPGFIAQRQCAQYPLSFAVKFDMQCDNDICFCNRFPEAITRLINSVSTSSCSGTDIDSATSILSAYCRQIPSLTYHFDTPVATGAGGTTAGTGGGVGQGSAGGATPAPGNSVIAITATTTFTTTDSKGQVSVVTSFIVTAHNTPAFKSAAISYGALSGVFKTGMALGICAFITMLWV